MLGKLATQNANWHRQKQPWERGNIAREKTLHNNGPTLAKHHRKNYSHHSHLQQQRLSGKPRVSSLPGGNEPLPHSVRLGCGDLGFAPPLSNEVPFCFTTRVVLEAVWWAAWNPIATQQQQGSCLPLGCQRRPNGEPELPLPPGSKEEILIC